MCRLLVYHTLACDTFCSRPTKVCKVLYGVYGILSRRTLVMIYQDADQDYTAT